MLVFRGFSALSEGERNFYLALVSIGILGAVMAFAVTYGFHERSHPIASIDPFSIWTAVAGAVGGICAFLSCYNRWFGFEGLLGWIRAAAGGVLLSGIAAVISGTMILPYYGTMFAPFQFAIGMIENPMLGVVWFGILVSVHKLMEHWRRERESIFLNTATVR